MSNHSASITARPTPVAASLSSTAAGAVVALAAAVAALGIQGGSAAALAAGGAGLVVGLIAVARRPLARVRSPATTDALTGLVNHRGFFELLAEALASARRDRTPVAVVMLDLDGFRSVNDAYGHTYGDAVLRAVGGRLHGVIRRGDVAARTGGEQFALILRDAAGGQAFAIAERARAAVATVPVDDFSLTCSAGIAAYPSDANDAPALCELAVTALRWAKRGGKRRTRRFDAGRTPADWTSRWRLEIEELLAAEQGVRAAFQPIVALATGRLVGYEALARFPDASRGSPDAWFAQAHGSGLGAELEAAAIDAALESLGRPFGTYLALNLSPSALTSPVVQAALPDDLTDLVIEITEHEFVPDDDALAAAVADLRQRGARIALDDAGAGHAGLKQLMRVRPDIVKLDRDLTHGIHADAVRTALVESFVRFARNVGATVCAEGIESLDDLEVLANLDVEWGQGYALARPGPPWRSVSQAAAEACRRALADALRAGIPAERQPAASSERRMVQLSAKLAGARSRADLRDALVTIAAELDAHAVALSRWSPDEDAIETLAETGGVDARHARFGAADYPLTARVLREQEAAQLFLTDPTTDRAEARLLLAFGSHSLLMVPVVSRGESIGLLEAYGRVDRSWTRAEIDRARVIANQFASVIEALLREPALDA